MGWGKKTPESIEQEKGKGTEQTRYIYLKTETQWLLRALLRPSRDIVLNKSYSSLPHHLVSVHVHLEILPILLCTSHPHLPVEFSPFNFPQSLTHLDESVTHPDLLHCKKKKSYRPNFITNVLSSGSNRNQIPQRSRLPL